MNLKKLLLVSTILGLSGLALISCQDTRKGIEITVAGQFGQDNNFKNLMEDFNAKHKGEMYITYTNYANYEEIKNANLAALAAHTQPNITICYPDHVEAYNAKKHFVANLDKYINDPEIGYSKEELADFIPKYWAEGSTYTFPGTYSIAFAKSSEAMFYNKDFLDKHNIAVPTTWEEFETVAPKVMEAFKAENKNPDADKGVYTSFALGYDSEANFIISSTVANGGVFTKYIDKDGKKYGSLVFVSSKDNPETHKPNNIVTVDILKKFLNFTNNGWFVTKNGLNGAYTSTKLTSEDLVFSIGSTGGIKYNVPEKAPIFKVGVAPVPHFQNKEAVYIGQGPSVCMFDKGEKQNRAAWLFLKEMVSTDFTSKYMLEKGYAAPRKSSYETAEFKKFIESTPTNNIDQLKQEVFKMMKKEQNKLYFTIPFKKSSQARTVADKMFHKIYTNDEAKKLAKDIQDPAMAAEKTVNETKLQEVIEKLITDQYNEVFN